MTITIYDANSKPKDFEIAANTADEIDYIAVDVVDECEIVEVWLNNLDRTTYEFHTKDRKIYYWKNGSYLVDGERIKEWLGFRFDPINNPKPFPLQRMHKFKKYN